MPFSGVFVRAILKGTKVTTWRAKCRAEPGDLVWVRETWARTPAGYIYRADEPGEAAPASPGGQVEVVRQRWRPSIHCPLAAARIWLQVLGRREVRRRVATEEDARAAGFATLEEFRAYPMPDRCIVLHFERCGPPPVRQLSLPFYEVD